MGLTGEEVGTLIELLEHAMQCDNGLTVLQCANEKRTLGEAFAMLKELESVQVQSILDQLRKPGGSQ